MLSFALFWGYSTSADTRTDTQTPRRTDAPTLTKLPWFCSTKRALKRVCRHEGQKTYKNYAEKFARKHSTIRIYHKTDKALWNYLNVYEILLVCAIRAWTGGKVNNCVQWYKKDFRHSSSSRRGKWKEIGKLPNAFLSRCFDIKLPSNAFFIRQKRISHRKFIFRQVIFRFPRFISRARREPTTLLIW